ncbi:hypothetical protein BG46_17045 [Brucella anthropi]|uniref:ParB family protein n=1 Tax=Brucella anthropi TaxID=529 RepID=UPI00044D28DD|nr:ParB family protein [Brucella anthropi]EXL06461.1 hypothetical protein BG46_17045 [Brucella anthropi]
MADVSPEDMAKKLLSDGFERSGPAAETLADPITGTPMVVTLDNLRPYELDPRKTRNPLYDEIKESIRERGLDAPPAITRRPGADHFIIRNGGNTRLSILRELWSETRDERFFRISCLFRPWPERGEIVALTGHLVENELHGGLSFIERAIAVEKLRELYEQEDGKPLSQTELARRLRADGYPVLQPHISRMREAIQHLLPAIPNVLYAGLGRHQVEQLISLRRAGARSWATRYDGDDMDADFEALFQQVLADFDLSPDAFDIPRVQDELIGQMADALGEKYDTLAFEFTLPEKRALPPVDPEPDPPPFAVQATTPPRPRSPSARETDPAPFDDGPHEDRDLDDDQEVLDEADADIDDLVRQHIVSPATSTERLQSIQKLVAEHLGEQAEDFAGDILKAVPVQAGGLYPVSDIWRIDPGIDTPERLRIHIAQLAREIADEAGMADWIEERDDGIGFECMAGGANREARPRTLLSRAIIALLHTLSAPYALASAPARIDTLHLVRDLGPLLQGWMQPETPPDSVSARLSDGGLVKLFRLIRLARRLIELHVDKTDGSAVMPEL